MIRITIPLKLPSCNDYINACRRNRYAGAELKRRTEDSIIKHLEYIPEFQKPVRINFTWVEENKRRDLDNICFAKKFILDALVKASKLKDDNRKIVTAFEDNFEYGDKAKVIMEISEVLYLWINMKKNKSKQCKDTY